MRAWTASCFVLVLGFCDCSRQAQPEVAADLLVRHANIHTMDGAMLRATAIAVQGDRILWVGDDGAAARFIGEKTRVVDAGGSLNREAFTPVFGDFEDMYIDFYRFISVGAIMSPPVVDRGVLYVASMDGNLYALQ